MTTLSLSRLGRQLRTTSHGLVSRCFSTEAASHTSNKTQIYFSKSRDPFLNLSIEHHLLQITPPESTVLLLYTNAPCVVFGRNQNPWLEVNLQRLADIKLRPESTAWTGGPVQLVRRRSGGGAVFHDEGNVNFSVICPPATFDRNKHAEMVVRALKGLGKTTTRVNERHDIVMDVEEGGKQSTFKVSGSAYKLTRLRSLHHGTCLLNSPNLNQISGLLRSPAEPFIKAKGVESVRSPVRNVGLGNSEFQDAVRQEFTRMYGRAQIEDSVGEDALSIQKVANGYRELQSRSWIYGQTPRFTLSTYPTDEDPRERADLDFDYQLQFEARHGAIEKFALDHYDSGTSLIEESSLVNTELWQTHDWESRLVEAGVQSSDAVSVGAWIGRALGTEFTRLEQ